MESGLELMGGLHASSEPPSTHSRPHMYTCVAGGVAGETECGEGVCCTPRAGKWKEVGDGGAETP